MAETNSRFLKLKRKMVAKHLPVKRLKASDDHLDLIYQNDFYPSDWCTQLDELIKDFNNKLTLIDKESNEISKELKSNKKQNPKEDILQLILCDSPEDLDKIFIHSTNKDESNSSTLVTDTIQYSTTLKISSSKDLNKKGVNELNKVIRNEEDQKSQILTASEQPCKELIIKESKTTQTNFTHLKIKEKDSATIIQPNYYKAETKFKANNQSRKAPKYNKNKAIDSQCSRNKIIHIYPKGDKILGHGINTPFYHREPVWVKRRGQGNELRYSISKLPDKLDNILNVKKRDRSEKQKAKQ